MRKLYRPACPHPQALANKNYKHALNKQALKESSHDKCMYCESKITHIDYGDVEHIKPKAANLFPELEFVWENHGYACTICNNNKRDKYFRETPFLNPYEDDPNRHIFAFGALLFTKNGSERGEITIKEIELNRPGLVEQRTARIQAVLSALNACHRIVSPHLKEAALEALKDEATEDREFSAVVDALLRAHGLEGQEAR